MLTANMERQRATKETQFDLQYTLAAICIKRKTLIEISDGIQQPKRKKAKKA